jgi:hypothetical protein
VESSFIINLWAGSSPPVLERLPDEKFQHLTVFTSRSREQGQDRFRLHVGYFDDQVAAEAAVQLVRKWYPSAWVVPANRHTPLAKLRGQGPAPSPVAEPPSSPIAVPPVLSEVTHTSKSAGPERAPGGADILGTPENENLSPVQVLALLEEPVVTPAVEKPREEAVVEPVSINTLALELQDEPAIADPLELYTPAQATELPSLADLTTELESANPMEASVVQSLLQEPPTFRGDGGRAQAAPEKRVEVRDWTSIGSQKAKPQPKKKSWLKRLRA